MHRLVFVCALLAAGCASRIVPADADGSTDSGNPTDDATYEHPLDAVPDMMSIDADAPGDGDVVADFTDSRFDTETAPEAGPDVLSTDTNNDIMDALEDPFDAQSDVSTFDADDGDSPFDVRTESAVEDADASTDAAPIDTADTTEVRDVSSCPAPCCVGNTCVAGSCTVGVCPAGTPLRCPSLLSSCMGEQCVDPTTDVQNCGTCGHACCAGQLCAAGVCVLSCGTGLTSCIPPEARCPACVNLSADPTNCGACGVTCAATDSCIAGRCEPPCTAGTTRCGSDCVDLNSDLTHCGSCSRQCPTVPRGTPTCNAGVCNIVCAAGYALVSSECVVDGARPIAPLSTSTVTSQRPSLRWTLDTATDGARVLLCRDRGLTSSCVTTDVTGRSTRPATSLAAGEWFWRLTPLRGGVPAAASGPVWQFMVPARDSGRDVSWGSTPDLNGDGYADVLVGSPGASSSRGAVSIYLGSASGLPDSASAVVIGPTADRETFGSFVRTAGDTDGDGFAETVVVSGNSSTGTTRIYVFPGDAPTLLGGAPIVMEFGTHDTSYATMATGVGDIDGDGYGDLVIGTPRTSPGGAIRVYSGSASGINPYRVTIIYSPGATFDFGASIAAAGDVNGDGFADVIVGAPYNGSAYVHFGAISGLSAFPAAELRHYGGSYGRVVDGGGDV